MLVTVFYFVLNMSISASAIILLLLIIRKIGFIRKRYVYLSWGLAFVRMILPFSLSSRYSLFNYTGGLIKRVISIDMITTSTFSPNWATPLKDFNVPHYITSSNSIGFAERYWPVEIPENIITKTTVIRDIFTVGSYIWLAGAAAVLITVIIMYLFTKKELGSIRHIRDDLYSSDKISSPLLAGIFKPKIILPEGFDPDCDEAEYVIAHERIHKRRMDNIWRLIAFLIVCIHWFNPLSWIMLRCFLKDMELSCDEGVVKYYDTGERKRYAAALLAFAGQKTLSTVSFAKSSVRSRVINVLDYKELSLLGASVSFISLAIFAVIVLTNPQV